MHELGVAKNIVKIILEECEEKGLSRLESVELEVGSLTNYKGDPIAFYFDEMKKGYPVLSSARLDIVEICGVGVCGECGVESEMTEILVIVCPACGSGEIKIIRGRELVVKKLVEK